MGNFVDTYARFRLNFVHQKNYYNPLIFDQVIHKNVGGRFFLGHRVGIGSPLIPWSSH